MRAISESPEIFEELYRQSPDPWNFATSEYELGKYAHTIEALPRERFASALDVGCSIGVLTAMLAPRCDKLLALDAAEGCLTEARRRCAAFPQVDLRRMFVPGEWPEGQFDLALLSEVLCYLSAEDLVALAEKVKASLLPGGIVEIVTWHADVMEAVDLFIASLGGDFEVLLAERRPLYRLDILAHHG